MAITRAQQAKQMLQDGGTTFGVLSDKPDISREIEQKVIDHENEYMERTGKVPPEFYGEKFRIKLMEEYMDRQPKANGGGMLVQPGFGGARQGYRGDAAAAAGAPGMAGPGPGADVGDGPETGQGPASDDRSDFMGTKGKTRGPTGRTDTGGFSLSKLPTVRLAKFVASKLGKFGPRGFNPDDLLGTPDFQGTRSSVDDDDDDSRGDEAGIRSTMRFNPLTTAASMMNPMTPQQGIGALDLNRIAYRFMADGGFLEDTDEARQAYGLGSIVRKITRPIKKVVKGVAKGVKKVAKSPIGRIALAVAAPYALGPAMAPYMASLSATQKAMLLSAATTGITQVASGEDLDFKDIALSAALSGAAAKALPPGGAPGVDGKAFNAARVSQAPKFQLPRGGGADLSNILTRGGGADFSRIPASLTKAASQVTKDPSLFSRITQGLGKFGSKGLEFAKENPFLTIAGASGLAGLMAKREEQEEPGEIDRGPGIDIAAIRRRPFEYLAPRFAGSEFDFYAAEGGQAKKEPVAKKIMPLLDMGGMEKDYREEGGFVPIGRMEKADDVPARLSKNEFVFTADAVRNAGDGDVDKGAEVMYNMMKNLEAGGDVSEESQGLEGARRMFQTSQRLEEVL